jgi:uncharacterized protein
MISVFLIYAAVGAVAGVLAGLLGIGGGLVIVPMMIFCLTFQGIAHEHIMHIALGTSMASIIFTSISSFRAHHKKGAVHWDVVRRIVLGIITGTLLGSFLASRLSTNFLKGFFVIFLFYVAFQMIAGKKPKPGRKLPGNTGMFGTGNIIGLVSSLVGIGGGTLSVPFMIWFNLPVHHAIGTSAAIGFPIAVSGAIGYIINGIGQPNLPSYSIGYLYGPAILGIVSTSIFTAPLGVKLAHSLPVDKLKRIFSVLLLVLGTRMLIGLLSVAQ